MATKYFIQPGPLVIGGNTNWNNASNWSTQSGGSFPGDAGVPTKDDDVVFDANSYDTENMFLPLYLNATVHINGPFPDYCVCKNLTVSTGYGLNIIYTNIFCRLVIYGTLNLISDLSTPIGINYANISGAFFWLRGTCGTISGVIANNLRSVGGKRIYYGATNTITDCPFWLPCNTVINSLTHISETICGPITRHIKTAIQLQAISIHPDDNYILDNNIDLLGFPWVPIGSYDNPFTGSFEGNNKTIKNLSYDDLENENFSALFGTIGSSGAGSFDDFAVTFLRADIRNLKLSNFILRGEYAIGALVGYCYGAKITNCVAFNITISTPPSLMGVFAGEVGGLIGDCYGFEVLPTLITNCSVNTLSVSSDPDSQIEGVGGLIGQTTTESDIDYGIGNILITNCHAKNINLNGADGQGSNTFGGLIGFAEGTIEKCYTSGQISNVFESSGGFIGEGDLLTVSNCYSHVNLSSDTDNFNGAIAGFIGVIRHMVMSITNCYASGNVTGNANSFDLGGFAGEVSAISDRDILSILNSYSVGVISPNIGDNDNSNGGFMGYLRLTTSPTFSVDNCACWTGSFAYAIGLIETDDFTANQSLTDQGWGTDEPINTHFYTKTHPVYAGSEPPIYSNNLEDESGNNLLDESSNVLTQE